MLILMRAFMVNPDIVLIDEVGSNIDDQNLKGFNLFLNNYLTSSNTIMVMATHNFHFELDKIKRSIDL